MGKRGSEGGKVKGAKARAEARAAYYLEPKKCEHCGAVIEIAPDKKAGSARRKRFCNHSCAAKSSNKIPRRRGPRPKTVVVRKCKVCGEAFEARRNQDGRLENARRCPSHRAEVPITAGMTKGELRARSSGYHNARAAIGHHAQAAFKSSGKEATCRICKYSRGVHVHHIQPVSEFPETAQIDEINAPGNLVALCPNHHWEAHHGFLSTADLR